MLPIIKYPSLSNYVEKKICFLDHFHELDLTKYLTKVNPPVSYLVHPFVPYAPFPYPLKTSGNCKIFWSFLGLEKGCIGNEWANPYMVFLLWK